MQRPAEHQQTYMRCIYVWPKHTSVASYTDWKAGVTKDFGVVNGALAIIGTNASERAYASPANGKFLGKTALVAQVSKSF